MENQEMKSFIDNHIFMDLFNEVINDINNIINHFGEQGVYLTEKIKSFFYLGGSFDYYLNASIGISKIEGISEWRKEDISEITDLGDLKKIKNFLELSREELKSKLGVEFLLKQKNKEQGKEQSIDSFEKLLDLKKCSYVGIIDYHSNGMLGKCTSIGGLMKIFIADKNNVLVNGLLNVCENANKGEINRMNLLEYIDTIFNIVQYDNFGIFRRDNKDLIINPTPDNIKKLTENIDAFKLKKQQKKANKIIPKEKNEENKIIPKEANEKSKNEEIKKQENAK